jgi:TRAP transporter TAXI family solute receptor
MRDGHIDAMIFTGAPRFWAVTELAMARDTVFVPMERDVIERIIEKYPEFSVRYVQPDEVPALNMTEAIPTVGMNHVAIVNRHIDEDTVYEMTKAVFENIELLHEIRQEFGVVTLENALYRGFPFEVHPGALRYFREMGIAPQ